jgi:hypothetical protein
LSFGSSSAGGFTLAGIGCWLHCGLSKIMKHCACTSHAVVVAKHQWRAAAAAGLLAVWQHSALQ